MVCTVIVLRDAHHDGEDDAEGEQDVHGKLEPAAAVWVVRTGSLEPHELVAFDMDGGTHARSRRRLFFGGAHTHPPTTKQRHISTEGVIEGVALRRCALY